eukprot:403347844
MGCTPSVQQKIIASQLKARQSKMVHDHKDVFLLDQINEMQARKRKNKSKSKKQRIDVDELGKVNFILPKQIKNNNSGLSKQTTAAGECLTGRSGLNNYETISQKTSISKATTKHRDRSQTNQKEKSHISNQNDMDIKSLIERQLHKSQRKLESKSARASSINSKSHSDQSRIQNITGLQVPGRITDEEIQFILDQELRDQQELQDEVMSLKTHSLKQSQQIKNY